MSVNITSGRFTHGRHVTLVTIPANPYTIGGNLSWANYTVSADVLLQQAGAAQLPGRAGTQTGFSPADLNACYFQVANTGAWSIFRDDTMAARTSSGEPLLRPLSGPSAALQRHLWAIEGPAVPPEPTLSDLVHKNVL
ncbi:MAG TPA: hypothetical protein VFQ44_29420 [Streptosporangiaceae bacterium]|nr:hypothetical protein [Streptosporangiaceae bacterium]